MTRAALIMFIWPMVMWVCETWRAHRTYPRMKLRDAIWEMRQKDALDERLANESTVLRRIAREHFHNKALHSGGPSVS